MLCMDPTEQDISYKNSRLLLIETVEERLDLLSAGYHSDISSKSELFSNGSMQLEATLGVVQ